MAEHTGSPWRSGRIRLGGAQVNILLGRMSGTEQIMRDGTFLIVGYEV